MMSSDRALDTEAAWSRVVAARVLYLEACVVDVPLSRVIGELGEYVRAVGDLAGVLGQTFELVGDVLDVRDDVSARADDLTGET